MFEKWIKDNKCGYDEIHYCNGITWRVIEMKDGWFAIWQRHDETGVYSPAIQARDLKHAMSWIYLREVVPIAMNCI